MAPPVQPVSPGQAVSAADWNALVAAVSGPSVVGGQGVIASSAGGIASLALVAALREYASVGRIRATHGADGDLCENVRYTAAVIGKSLAVVDHAAPVIGRWTPRGVPVWVARPGDPCIIVSLPLDSGGYESLLWVLTEAPQTSRCVNGSPVADPDPRPPAGGPLPVLAPPVEPPSGGTPTADPTGTSPIPPGGGEA